MSGRSAVVTGASKGIGRAIAIALARDGWDVVVNFATNEGAAKETADAIFDAGAQAVVVGGDVTDPATSARLASAASELGVLEAWVNNAGVSALAPIIDTSVADMEWMLAVNCVGTFHGLQAAARTMIAAGTRGRILNLSPSSFSPKRDSTRSRYIQPAEPVYQVQPPRPTCGTTAYTSAATT